MGTLLRSAEAFGATGVLALPGTVSQWNAKALRASSGSAFRLPLLALSQEEAVSLLRQRGLRLLATTVSGGDSLDMVDLRSPIALLIGNEGSGLPRSLVQAADACVTIPCPGPVESLNAAVAASVLLYEASRQRHPASNAGRKATSL
jgi:TrmH family RNA methyltransferase